MRPIYRLATLRLDIVPWNNGELKDVEISPTLDSHNHLEVVYVLMGMDLHKNSVNVTEVEEDGSVAENYEIENSEVALNVFTEILIYKTGNCS
ncbi:MAG: hypothetical protein QW292_04090 [Candidatus Parvarchaeota archaeon]